MGDGQKTPGWFGGAYGSSDPSMNVPVTSGSNAMVSPYLNFDPAYISPSGDSQFIFPEGASHTRGRFEMAFAQIGGSVLIGGAVGGLNGCYSGLRETAAAQLTGPVRRTQMLNFITKRGAGTAQTLGIVALMYSVFGTVIYKVRDVEDELNTLTAATATGLLYKSSGGLKSCLRAGGIGFGLASVYCLWTSKDKIKSLMES